MTNFINIDELGCRDVDTDPDFNNSPLINAELLQQGKTTYLPLFVPGKGYVIKTPIVLPDRTGATLLGVGGVSKILHSSHWTQGGIGGPVSRFIWRGTPNGETSGEAMLINRSFGGTVDGITLQGRYNRGYPNRGEMTFNQVDPNNRAKYGVYMEGTQRSGTNTGKTRFGRIGITLCDTAVMFPRNDPAENHADYQYWDDLYLAGCQTGYVVENNNSVLHFVNRIHFSGLLDTLFNFAAGGPLKVGMIGLNRNTTVLRCGDRPANGTSSYDLGTIFIDKQASEVTLVHCKGGRITNAFVRASFHQPERAPGKGPLIKAQGNAIVEIHDSHLIRENQVEMKMHPVGSDIEYTPTVILSRCRFQSGVSTAKVINAAKSSGKYRLAWKDCTTQFGAPIADGQVSTHVQVC